MTTNQTTILDRLIQVPVIRTRQVLGPGEERTYSRQVFTDEPTIPG